MPIKPNIMIITDIWLPVHIITTIKPGNHTKVYDQSYNWFQLSSLPYYILSITYQHTIQPLCCCGQTIHIQDCTMITDALFLYHLVITSHGIGYKRTLVYHEKRFQLTVSSQCQENQSASLCLFIKYNMLRVNIYTICVNITYWFFIVKPKPQMWGILYVCARKLSFL